MTLRYALLDGVAASAAEVAAADPRLRDPVPPGVYETMLVRRGLPVLAGAHVQRHAASCASLGLDAPATPRLLAAAYDAAARCPGRGRLRLLRWAGDDGETRSIVTAEEEPPPKRRTTLAIAPSRREAGDGDRYRHKRLDAPDLERMRTVATAAGRLDMLILDERGIVLEGARTNLFWRVGRTLFTPTATLPLLPGIRRAWLLAAAQRAGFETREVEAPLDEVQAADEVLVTNAILGVVRRASIES